MSSNKALTVLEETIARREKRRAEVEVLSPELRHDLERLCVQASHPDYALITESRAREILGCNIQEFYDLAQKHDPQEKKQ